MERIIVGVTGASGVVLALHAIEAIVQAGYQVDLVLSKAALLTAKEEIGRMAATSVGFLSQLSPSTREAVCYHPVQNIAATIASGSHRTKGMMILPCSMATLASVAMGLADNLLRRAADVVLKERRKLVIVPRESPFSSIHLQHMLSLTQMGAIIVPAIPGWYTHPKSVEEMEKFIVGKALDAFGVEHNLYVRWRQEEALDSAFY